jgi:hypothetical protein
MWFRTTKQIKTVVMMIHYTNNLERPKQIIEIKSKAVPEHIM